MCEYIRNRRMNYDVNASTRVARTRRVVLLVDGGGCDGLGRHTHTMFQRRTHFLQRLIGSNR